MSPLIIAAMFLLCIAHLAELAPADAQRGLRIGCAIAAAVLLLVALVWTT